MAREALAREIEVTRSVAHPAFRAVREVASEGARLVVAFELIEGEPWIEHLRRDPASLLRTTIALLRALRALHHAGFAHGDLKPEHVIIERSGALRLIDLGLAARLGTTAKGGTHGYLAPELLQGEPLKVASDLYALGATLRALPDLDRVPTLRALGERCLSASPSDRPSSTGAALVALGALGGGEPLASSIPSVLSEALAKDSALVVVELPRGGGRSALAQALVDDAIARGERLMLLPTESERVPWVVLADALGLAGQDPAHRAARAALKLTEPSPSANEPARHFLVDGADRLDEDGRVALLAAARAIAVRALSGERAPRDGRLVVIGVDAPLREALSMLGALVVEVPQLTEREVARLLASHGARSDEASVRELLACTEGRRGVASELARRLGEVPEASVRDVWHAMDATEERAPEASEEPRARAEALLVGGAPRRALSLLRELPVDRITSALSLACELAAGSLEQAELRSVAAIDLAAPEERTALELSRARILERMGRHAEARALAEELSMRGSRALDRAAACAIAATSALALGAPAEADALAEAGLASLRPTEPESDLESAEPQNAEPRRAELRARLHSLRSDAALRRHQPAQALSFAAAARVEAERSGESLPMAHAIARTAAAHALSGDPQTARAAWRQALHHAEASGEVTALPPYVMNLATADHAAYEVADALAGYERAASLAARLGRRGSRAAALTNLGNLFGMIGADGEALSVLSEAEREAESAGVPLYAAQAKLFAAEVLAASDPSRAAREVSAATIAFSGLGASRQALEALLCAAEIELARAQPKLAQKLFAEIVAQLEQAGLSGRGALLSARAALALGDLEAARKEADRALAESRREADRDQSGQALVLLAEIHERLGTGASEGLRAEARTLFGDLAARVPPGLREAYLGKPVRAGALRAQRERTGPSSSRALSDASRRLLSLLSRVLLEEDEQRVLETALDEAVTLTRAERAFLLLRREGSGGETKRPEVAAARNVDRETIQKSRFRWSRSVAEKVLSTGEPLVTASASEDPSLAGSRSVLDLGLRSILTVPVRSRTGVIGALYLDHRFETGRFDEEDRELVQALADVIGLSLENGRLHREARARQHALERTSEALQEESAKKDLELSRLADALEHGRPLEETSGIVGSAASLRRALDVAAKVARSEIAVLIEGESGTGKELFARFVHRESLRKSGPWVALNCGALPESILESELFGHEKGAFTGAVRDHLGVFRSASGGTVFLDEIGELPASAQARLLRVLQEREVQPVGGRRAVKVDVRVICATNRDLQAEVAAGRFRQDLYFRLVGVAITLPPLRERREDIPAIAAQLLRRIQDEPGMRAVTLSKRASAVLVGHDWPGNVRELEQALRRAVAVSEGEVIEPSDLGLTSAVGRAPRRDAHQALDTQILERALRDADGNRTRAAEVLGITRVTLHRAIKRLGVRVEAKPGRPRTR